MKAIVYTKYGPPDVLQLKEVGKPVPKDDEVLVKMYAVSLNQADWHMVTSDIFVARLMGGGLLKPRKTIPGADVAGVVETVGRGVTQFAPGDAVYGDLFSCANGGLAEYAVAPERILAHKPANLSFAESAAVPMAAVTALQGLRDIGHIQPGQKVLVHGASGGVGTYAVQIAKAFGAMITAVCSTRNLEQAKALGADYVIDYTKEDFTKNEERYDLIFAANGNRPIRDYKHALAPKGIYVMAGGSAAQIFQAVLLGSLFSEKGGRKLAALSAKVNQKDLLVIKELIEKGKVRPVIDKSFELSQTADAFRYLGGKHAQGKIVIEVAGEGA